jgi:hypothetical protein
MPFGIIIVPVTVDSFLFFEGERLLPMVRVTVSPSGWTLRGPVIFIYFL